MRVSDYGGHNHDRGSGTVTDRRVQGDSFRCETCGKISYFTRTQVRRMKAAPRCVGCGGLAIETEASVHRRVGYTTRQIGKVVGKMAVEVAPGKLKAIGVANGLECPCCEKTFRTPVARQLHIEERHPEYEEPSTDSEVILDLLMGIKPGKKS